MIEDFKSESGVDKWIRENVFSDYSYKGLMVEVGAATPELISNSYHWRKNGWRTISIEPNPKFVKMHKEVGSEVYEYACSDVDEDNVSFTIVHDDNLDTETTNHSFSHISDNSLIDKNIPDQWKAVYDSSDKTNIKIKVRKLNTILENLSIDKIDILTIDVEGNEKKVINGFDILKYKPSVIVIENIMANFNLQEILLEFGYIKRAILMGYDEIYTINK